MKKYFFLFFSFILVSSLIKAQDINDYKKLNSTFLNFLPSNTDPEDLRPSDIPSTLKFLSRWALVKKKLKKL